MKYLLALVAAFSFAHPAWAKAPSDASIEKLLTVTQVKKGMEQMFSSTEDMMMVMAKQAVSQKKLGSDEQQVMEKMMKRIVAVMREEIGWEQMKSIYIQTYRETFTQKEVDDLLAFYATPSGKSMIEKMPATIQKSVALSQARMGPLMQRMQKEIAQVMAEVEAEQQKTDKK